MADTLVCRIELDKKDGVTVTVENSKDKITQTIILDGTAITTTVKGKSDVSTITQKQDIVTTKVKSKSDTSTITQKAESVAVKCKNYSVNAETIKMTSTKATTHTSKDKYSVTSTKDMSVKSMSKFSLVSMKGMQAKSGPCVMSAKPSGTLQIKAPMAKLQGMTKVDVKGGASAKMSAAKVEVSGKAMAALEAPITNVGKVKTSIKGAIVTVGGGIVKLG